MYQIGDDVVAPTPAPTPEVEEPTPAPTPEEEEGEYEELGCAADLTEGVRVRGSDGEPGAGGSTAAGSSLTR